MQMNSKSGTIKDIRQKNWDVIVIGSGMGGMSCAAALAKSGRKVILLEQHYVLGGLTHAFTRKGFSWDVGVHCLGEMGPNDLPFKVLMWLTDSAVQMESFGDIYETFYLPDGSQIDFPGSVKKYEEVLIERFPHEAKGIRHYFSLCKKAANRGKLFFIRKILPLSLDRVAGVIADRLDSALWEKSTLEVLQTFITDPKLITILTGQWGYYGNTPAKSSWGIHAMTTRHFRRGGYYPIGGASVIAEGFRKVIELNGGQTIVRAPVADILIENETAVGVRLENGTELTAQKIISCAGARNTVEKMLPTNLASLTDWRSQVLKTSQSPSYICLNLGFEGDIKAAGASKANQWFFETWDHNQDLWDLKISKSMAPITYLSFPSLKDPLHTSTRHTGEAVTFVPWETFAKWSHTRRGNREKAYLEFKSQIESRWLEYLTRKKPDLMKLCVYHELSTPLSAQFFVRAPQGAIYGMEATPERFRNRALRTRTPIKNLYLGGADIGILGVTGAMMGGVLAAGTIEPKILRHLVF